MRKLILSLRLRNGFVGRLGPGHEPADGAVQVVDPFVPPARLEVGILDLVLVVLVPALLVVVLPAVDNLRVLCQAKCHVEGLAVDDLGAQGEEDLEQLQVDGALAHRGEVSQGFARLGDTVTVAVLILDAEEKARSWDLGLVGLDLGGLDLQ